MSQSPFFWLLTGLFVFLLVRQLLAARNRIPSSQARAKVAAGAQLLDVRSEAEFRSGSLPGARNIPVSSLASRVGELDPKRPLVVFCASGMRSANALSTLRSKGFTEVYDLGPLSAW